MTEMERRRLQLYATNIRLRTLQELIGKLESVLGYLYQEIKALEDRALAKPTRPTKKSRRR